MKNFSIFLILILILISSANAQIVNIPDDNFKYSLVNESVAEIGNGTYEDVDTNNDGEIQVSEAEAVLLLGVGYRDIGSIEGIQSFTNLIELDCGGNELTIVDMSKNINLRSLSCWHNNLTFLDFSQNSNLELLDCSYNDLTELNVNNNPHLTLLRAHDNQLTSLDVTNNTALDYLAVSYNQITELDVTQISTLRKLHAKENLFTSLNLSQNPILERLYLDDNLLSALDVSGNPILEFLYLENNQVQLLDLSQNSELSILDCVSNELVELNIRNGNNEEMFTMRATNNPSLACIEVDDFDYANEQNNWLKDSSSTYSEDCLLGLASNKFIEEDVLIYVNQYKTSLTARTLHYNQINRVSIYAISGEKLFQYEVNSIETTWDISLLSSGVYFIKIHTEGNVLSKKFLIK